MTDIPFHLHKFTEKPQEIDALQSVKFWPFNNF